VDGFIAFCNENGLVVRRSAEFADSYRAAAPLVPGLDIEADFRVFPPGTTGAEMRRTLQETQHAFPFLNEDAGLAMSAGVALPADADDLSSGLRAHLIQLLRDYLRRGPLASPGRSAAAPATTRQRRKPARPPSPIIATGMG